MRVKLPHAKGNRALLESVKESISPLPGVRSVEVNPTTGSVLVHYDPEVHQDWPSQLAAHAEREKLFMLRPPELTEADEITAKIEAEAGFLAEHSETARTVVNLVKHVDEVIKRETNNTVDLKVLLPLGLAVYAFLEIGSDMFTPLWVTLGIFSFNSFVRLHHPVTTVHTDHHEVIFDNADQRVAQDTERLNITS
jgi:cation transport ATPase